MAMSGFMTCTVTFTLCVKEPLEAVILMMYFPAGVVAGTLMLSVDDFAVL